MNCAICKTGAMVGGTTTVTLERDGTTVVIKETPAQVCDNCGEYYLSDEVTSQVHELAEEAVRRHAVLEILQYGAVLA